MHRGHVNSRWRRVAGWFTICLIANATALISLPPGSAEAHILGAARRYLRAQTVLQPTSTPAPTPPGITPTPYQGPVKTLVTLQGTDWPAGSQVLLSYDSDTSCAPPNLIELSPDPRPTVSSTGTFSASFSWPKVATTGIWYICAATSDGAAAAVAAFTVLSLSPPSLTLLTRGPFMPGQTMTVQGQNWFPGGWSITFALQRIHSVGSFFLEASAISRVNGTFDPTLITIPTYLPPGSYMLVATMEQQALRAQTGAITIAPTPTPTPTATLSPSPTPPIITPTPTISRSRPSSTAHRLSGPLLALVIISGGMALTFALIGTALLIYLVRSRPTPSAALALEQLDETAPLKSHSSS